MRRHTSKHWDGVVSLWWDISRTPAEIAAAFGISKKTVNNIWVQARAEGALPAEARRNFFAKSRATPPAAVPATRPLVQKSVPAPKQERLLPRAGMDWDCDEDARCYALVIPDPDPLLLALQRAHGHEPRRPDIIERRRPPMQRCEPKEKIAC